MTTLRSRRSDSTALSELGVKTKPVVESAVPRRILRPGVGSIGQTSSSSRLATTTSAVKPNDEQVSALCNVYNERDLISLAESSCC